MNRKGRLGITNDYWDKELKDLLTEMHGEGNKKKTEVE